MILKITKSNIEDIAEIVGLHFGDGHMDNRYNYTYIIDYTFNRRDTHYAQYVIELFKKTFDIQLKRYEKNNYITLYYFSKEIVNFFNDELQIPFSPKKKLIIPKFIFDDTKLLKRFLRGLFDTDGCFYIQKDGKYRYQLLKITTGLKDFAYQINEAFEKIELRSYICRKKSGYDIVIRNKHSYERFLKEISPKN